MEKYDIVVIGGGPGGLAAAASARKHGAQRVVLLEREDEVGGVLNQCIHDGFGLHRYRKQLSGPEYAYRSEREAKNSNAELRTGYMVTRITCDGQNKIVTAVSRDGLCNFTASSVILATGCRERTRGAISIPGSRPAGVFTAGVAQNLINCKNIMVGRRVVILGSGDIGLIMARRLTLEGAKVLAVVEIMPNSGGLTRNIKQCLYDFDIPLYLEHTVSRIIGKQRLTAVEISKVDKNRQIMPETTRKIDCDCLVLSVGLIPENELAKGLGVELDPKTNGAVTDSFLQTNIPGVFACGNARKVMDLADFVSAQGELAGKNAVSFINGQSMTPWEESQGTQLQKGVPTSDDVICTLCPNGCRIRINSDGQAEGNRCPWGAEFAKRELADPERILTTTLLLENAAYRILPVRSDRPVKKAELPELVALLHQKSVRAPVAIGQVLFSRVGKNGVNIVAESSADAVK